MVSKGSVSDDETSLCSACTSESSDSHSYLLWDIEDPSNNISEEWDAIERTLYQESGKHVTDPALLKECQLWRETFLHLRARGTAISTGNGALQETKSLQAVDENQLALSELTEKRGNIRKAVVSQIVERLTSKLCLNKENSSECTEKWKEITDESTVDKLPGAKTDNESYFERGKKKTVGEDTVKRMNVVEASTSLRSYVKSPFSNGNIDFECNSATDILESKTNSRLWSGQTDEKKDLSKGKRFASNMAKNEEILRSENLRFKISEKPFLKTEAGMSDSLSSIAKPFEMTKKIDKKYEVMLERILDGKRVTISAIDKRISPKPFNFGGKLMRDSKPGEEKHRKNHKQLPKINFTNNWMTRAEQNFLDPYGVKESIGRGFRIRTGNGRDGRTIVGPSRSASNTCQFDEGFFEELKREMWIQKRSQLEKSEAVNLEKPQMRQRHDQHHTASKTQKSSSCGDLQKKTPKVKNGSLNCSLEKGRSDVLMRGKKTKISKNAGHQNLKLPPIEASIICTEIIGKPKVATRTLPKKYM